MSKLITTDKAIVDLQKALGLSGCKWATGNNSYLHKHLRHGLRTTVEMVAKTGSQILCWNDVYDQ